MMNSHVKQFYQKSIESQDIKSPFLEVISLGEDGPSLEDAKRFAPKLPKGWYELCKLSTEDRIEFTRDFWLSTLPFVPNFKDSVLQFFARLDDVGVFLTKDTTDHPFQAEMVYSLKSNTSFFRGLPPSSEEAIQGLQQDFDNRLPRDFLQFLQIHNGFAKVSDQGIIFAESLQGSMMEFHRKIAEEDRLVTCHGKPIDPSHLIPFYHCYGRHSFQCFYSDWYPVGDMGNVYFSGVDNTISEIQNKSAWADHLAFPTFLDWLAFYLEEIDL